MLEARFLVQRVERWQGGHSEGGLSSDRVRTTFLKGFMLVS